MEIRNNIGPDPIDLTKSNRDAIRERNPIPADHGAEVDNGAIGQLYPKRVKLARDKYQAQQASEDKRVHDARIRYESVHKRVREARKRFQGMEITDQVTLSKGGQDLATPPASDDATTRVQAVSDLKAQYQGGKLDVDSLVAEAARRMLSGD